MRILIIFAASFIFSAIRSQNLPVGYINYFESDFSTITLNKDLTFSPSASFKIENGILTIKENPDSVSSFVPPAAMFIDNNIFGDFISEIVLVSNANSDSLSGTFFIFGLRNKDNYYFIQLNSAGASFNKMYKGKISEILHDSSFVMPLGKNVKIRVERNILERSITLKIHSKEAKFTDPNLVMGYFGIGTSRSKLAIDKINIWAPASLDGPLQIFK